MEQRCILLQSRRRSTWRDAIQCLPETHSGQPVCAVGISSRSCCTDERTHGYPVVARGVQITLLCFPAHCSRPSTRFLKERVSFICSTLILLHGLEKLPSTSCGPGGVSLLLALSAPLTYLAYAPRLCCHFCWRVTHANPICLLALR